MIFVQDFSVICSLGKNKIEARKNLKMEHLPASEREQTFSSIKKKLTLAVATEIFRRYQKSFQE